MNKKDELTLELAKNKADEIIIKKELETEKERFISSLKNGIGNEIKNYNVYEINKPIKIKKSFLTKIKEFFSKINKTIVG